MTAIACLKVFVSEDPAETEQNAALIAKVAGDYLKGAWLAAIGPAACLSASRRR